MPQRVLVQGKRVGIVYAEQSAASFLGKGPDRGPAGPVSRLKTLSISAGSTRFP